MKRVKDQLTSSLHSYRNKDLVKIFMDWKEFTHMQKKERIAEEMFKMRKFISEFDGKKAKVFLK